MRIKQNQNKSQIWWKLSSSQLLEFVCNFIAPEHWLGDRVAFAFHSWHQFLQGLLWFFGWKTLTENLALSDSFSCLAFHLRPAWPFPSSSITSPPPWAHIFTPPSSCFIFRGVEEGQGVLGWLAGGNGRGSGRGGSWSLIEGLRQLRTCQLWSIRTLQCNGDNDSDGGEV